MSLAARVLATAATLASAAPAVAGQTATPVLVDRDVTVGAAASIAAAAGAAVAAAEDAVIPVRLFEEHGAPRRAANVTYRLLKLAVFDLPQELWLSVANHEVSGHGGRLRELFDGPIGYEIDAPPPYGSGGGSTTFEFDREPGAAHRMAVSAGGMEANAAAAALIARQAFLDGKLAPRSAIRYLAFELDTLSYAWSTGDEPEAPGHDVSDILQIYNEVAARNGAQALSARTVRRQSLVALANPTLAYAAYGIARHVWSGADAVPVPVLSIAGARVLPLARFRFAPFGMEWAVAADIAHARHRMHVELSVGRAPGSTPWRIGAVHARAQPWRGWHAAVDLHAWRQPSLAEDTAALSPAAAPGGMLRGRAERAFVPLPLTTRRATVLIELGVKSRGYVPGEPLGSGVVARLGLGVPLP